MVEITRSNIYGYEWKCLITKTAHVKYESTISIGSDIIAKVKVHRHVGQRLLPRSLGQIIWHELKGLIPRNTQVKYESSTSKKGHMVFDLGAIEKGFIG